LKFDIPLAFACLREAPPAKVLVRRAGVSAKAGILTFDIKNICRNFGPRSANDEENNKLYVKRGAD
jgi:hypothetical protein